MKLSLDLNVGDGYLVSNAVNDLGSYKINIQQGWPDTTLIMPVDLKLDAGTSIIVFDTELGSKIHLKAKLKNEDTDMIRLYRSGYLEELSKEVSDNHGYTAGIRRRIELFEIHTCTFDCDAKPNKRMNVWVDPLFRN